MENKMEQILIVEDDLRLNQGLCKALKSENRKIISCMDLKSAREQLEIDDVSLILLDINLPDGNGLDFLKELKEEDAIRPVILLTANDTDMDIVEGLEQGADDYITKPFNILEVKARIKAILRRISKQKTEKENENIIAKNDMKIDRQSRRVYVKEKEINLTAKEFDLLELLAMNPDKVYSREELLNIVWGYEYPGDARTVDVHVRRLREKIEPNPSDPMYVYTKWGVGYYFRG